MITIEGKDFSEETVKAALKAHCDWPEDVPNLRRGTYEYGGSFAERVLMRVENVEALKRELKKTEIGKPMVLSFSARDGSLWNSWTDKDDSGNLKVYSNIREVK